MKPTLVGKTHSMPQIVITEKELETILKLIDDWGWEYSLKCETEEVADLKKSLEAAYFIESEEEVEGQ